MENPFTTRNDFQEGRGPVRAPSVSVRGDEMEVDPSLDELQAEEPRRYKVPKSKWF